MGRRASGRGAGSGFAMSSSDLHGRGRRPACRDLQACHASGLHLFPLMHLASFSSTCSLLWVRRNR